MAALRRATESVTFKKIGKNLTERLTKLVNATSPPKQSNMYNFFNLRTTSTALGVGGG